MSDAETLDWLGPVHCSGCKDKPNTKWGDANHPICANHRQELLLLFNDFPERVLHWTGTWADRTYTWVEEVRESRDSEMGALGDQDPDGSKMQRMNTVHDLHAAGAISRAGMMKLIDLRSDYLGYGRRTVPADDWSAPAL